MTESAGKDPKNFPSILIYGFGNPGRQDDGLGPMFVERLESWAAEKGLDFLSFETAYQLNIEDALLVSRFDLVIFADADKEGGPFRFEVLQPAVSTSFSTHAMAPEAVLALCGQLYPHVPEARMMAIGGCAWEMSTALSEGASANLESALEFIKGFLLAPLLGE